MFLERTFAVKIFYYGGLNLLGWTEAVRKGRVALGLRIELAPSVSLSLLGDHVSLVAMAGYGPGSRLFVRAGAPGLRRPRDQRTRRVRLEQSVRSEHPGHDWTRSLGT